MLRGRERKGKAYNRHLLSQESADAVYYFWLTAVLALRSEITILLLEDTSVFVSRLRNRGSHMLGTGSMFVKMSPYSEDLFKTSKIAFLNK